MLLRLYRLSDKFGVVLIKLLALFSQSLAEGAQLTVMGVQRGTGGVFRGVRLVVRWLRLGITRLLMGVWWVIGRIWLLLWTAMGHLLNGLAWVGDRVILRSIGWLARSVWRVIITVFRVSGRTAQKGAVSAISGTRSARNVMARRAERQQARQVMEQVDIVEDPLRVQNRTLSLVVVVMGFVLVGAIIWATSRTPDTALTPVAIASNGDTGAEITFAEEAESSPTAASIVNTPVPTATPVPAVLQVRGSIAYVAREDGQQDIWVVDVGNISPIRLTNDPADERDPAWSPDGQRLAYASRKDGNWELYILDLLSEETSRLTYDLSFQANPAWSPDGNFLVYESYQGNNLDLYIMRVDGSEPPIRLTENSAPDFSPVWSPDGRRIAFTSWRDGNQDIYIYSLDDPRDEGVLNLTNTVERHEDFAAWSPDGELLTYSALDEGIHKVFVKSSNEPNSLPQVLERGQEPDWSPDGTSIVLAVDSIDSTHLVASPFAQTGVATEIIPVLLGASDPNWTNVPLPPSLVNGGGKGPARDGELYIEQQVQFDADPPYRLDTLINVTAPSAVLNDRVNDSFNALREHALERIGYDFLGELEDAFWRIDRPPQPGEERRNWHMTGRAFSINRNAIAGFPPPIEVVREDIGVNTYWRVYVRVADDAQNGQLGEPLRQMPWDFASRNQGDVEAYDQGGRLRAEMPEGYYVDLTTITHDFGWERMPAGRDWRANFNSTNFWMYRKTDGLNWYEAMREIYTDAQLGGFVPTATPAPIVPEIDQNTGT